MSERIAKKPGSKTPVCKRATKKPKSTIPTETAGVYTSVVGNNDVLFRDVVRLYLKDGFRVADVTYGRGIFWRQVDTKRFDFLPSDKITCKCKYDFRSLPYPAGTFDCVVFDPPYTHNPGNLIVDKNYQNAAMTKGMNHRDIFRLYCAGMLEAKRILKPGGMLWVKCKDEIESGVQRWSHIEIYECARKLGFFVKDLFVLMQKAPPVIQYPEQKHARKNHSYLWVFKKPTNKERKHLATHNLV